MHTLCIKQIADEHLPCSTESSALPSVATSMEEDPKHSGYVYLADSLSHTVETDTAV